MASKSLSGDSEDQSQTSPLKSGQFVSYPEGKLSYDEVYSEGIPLDFSQREKVEEEKSTQPARPSLESLAQPPPPQFIDELNLPREAPTPSITMPQEAELEGEKKVDEWVQNEEKLAQLANQPLPQPINVPQKTEILANKERFKLPIPKVSAFKALRVAIFISVFFFILATFLTSLMFLRSNEDQKKEVGTKIEESKNISGEFVFPPAPKRDESGFEPILINERE